MKGGSCGRNLLANLWRYDVPSMPPIIASAIRDNLPLTSRSIVYFVSQLITPILDLDPPIFVQDPANRRQSSHNCHKVRSSSMIVLLLRNFLKNSPCGFPLDNCRSWVVLRELEIGRPHEAFGPQGGEAKNQVCKEKYSFVCSMHSPIYIVMIEK